MKSGHPSSISLFISSSPVIIGSPPRFPLVMTSGPVSSNNIICNGLQGRNAPIRSLSPQISVTKSFFFFNSTIGLAFEVRSSSSFEDTSQNSRMASIPGNMTANGFLSRCLNSRSLFAAALLIGENAKWKPPISLIATIFSSFKAFTVCARITSVSFSIATNFPPLSKPTNFNVGPQV